MSIKFHKTSDKSMNAKKIDEISYHRMIQGGIATLFDVETQVGGFRFLHGYDKEYKATYFILYFPNLEGKPIPYSLQLKDFHMLVSFYLIGLQVEEDDVPVHPHQNLVYNLMKMVGLTEQ